MIDRQIECNYFNEKFDLEAISELHDMHFTESGEKKLYEREVHNPSKFAAMILSFWLNRWQCKWETVFVVELNDSASGWLWLSLTKVWISKANTQKFADVPQFQVKAIKIDYLIMKIRNNLLGN